MHRVGKLTESRKKKTLRHKEAARKALVAANGKQRLYQRLTYRRRASAQARIWFDERTPADDGNECRDEQEAQRTSRQELTSESSNRSSEIGGREGCASASERHAGGRQGQEAAKNPQQARYGIGDRDGKMDSQSSQSS